MYIAGRLRTASRPSSTAIEDESYACDFLPDMVVPAIANTFSLLNSINNSFC
jgi:hypothetical protein